MTLLKSSTDGAISSDFAPHKLATAFCEAVNTSSSLTHYLTDRHTHTPFSLWGQTLNNTDSWDHSPEPEDVVGQEGEGGREEKEE